MICLTLIKELSSNVFALPILTKLAKRPGEVPTSHLKRCRMRETERLTEAARFSKGILALGSLSIRSRSFLIRLSTAARPLVDADIYSIYHRVTCQGCEYWSNM